MAASLTTFKKTPNHRMAPALANIRDTVVGWTPKSIAASAAVLAPVETIVTISSC
jgi:hypothetical protein